MVTVYFIRAGGIALTVKADWRSQSNR